ncbi:MAG: hypothetical protein M3Z25_23680, partial [Actinomycetota bacterium]|nr:hypothetical protein [Actinomycetota bacterium]
MTTINELPAHVLLVHLVVVLVPLSAFMVLLTGCWPAARRRFGLLTAALAGLALVSVPLTTDAGEWLERHLPSTPLVRAHTQLGDTMLPWAAGLFLVAAALAAREFLRTRRATSASATAGPGAATAPVSA